METRRRTVRPLGGASVMALMAAVVVVVVCVVVCSVGSAEGMVVDRFTRHGPGLKYLAKFCFDEGHGDFYWHADTEKGDFSNKVFVALYDNEEDSWPTAEDSSNCSKILAASKQHWMVGNKQHEHVHITNHMPRYWYVALFECAAVSTQEYELNYRIEFTNDGDWWSTQFSFDIQGLMATYLTLGIVYFFYVIAVVVAILIKKQQGRLNHLLRLFGLVVVLMEAAFWCMFIDHAVYADDGRGIPGIDGFGQLLDLVAMLLFMWLLLLLAKGWVVSTGELRGRRVLVIGFCIFLVIYVSFFIWDNLGIDERSTYNVYETIPSLLNLVARIMLWGFFMFHIIMTWFRRDTVEISSEDTFATSTAKRIYLGILATVGSVWFLSLPLFVVISLGIAVYDRLKTIIIVYLAITAVVHLLMGMWLYLVQTGSTESGYTWLGGFSLNDPQPQETEGTLDLARGDFEQPHAGDSEYNNRRAGAGAGAGVSVELQTRKGNSDGLMDNKQPSFYDAL